MMKFRQIFLLVCVLLSNSVQLIGQSHSEKLFDNYAYSMVVGKFEKKLEKDSGNFELKRKLAIAYTKFNQIEKALSHYVEIIILGNSKILDIQDWNNIGQLYLSTNKKRNAAFAFKHLTEKEGINMPRQTPINNEYFKAESYMPVNSEFSEFCPVLWNGQLIFTSDRKHSPFEVNESKWTGTPYLSVYKLINEGEKPAEVRSFSQQLSDMYHIGPISFSNDGNKIFYTKADNSHKGVNKSKVYTGEYIKGKWKNLTGISLNSTEYSVAHPLFIDESNTLVFASDMPGGYGGMDLYYSKYENDSWSTPVNFGPKVNTPFNEVFPCKKAGKPEEIYFSSNGRFGFGGLDIYKLELKDGDVASVQILPKSINSNRDDFGIVFTSDTSGYVSSDRLGGVGRDDIFSFALSKVLISGHLLSGETNKPAPGQKLYMIKKNQKEPFDSVMTDTAGYFQFSKFPFEDVSIFPADVEKEPRYIRSKDSNINTDPIINLFLMSSEKEIMDTIGFNSGGQITLILDKSIKKRLRCVEYADGKKAINVLFGVRDSLGRLIDTISTGDGCFSLKKMYPKNSYLELLADDDVQLKFKADDASDEILEIKTIKDKMYLLEEAGELLVVLDDSKTVRKIPRCVEYADGRIAINVLFGVRDSSGRLIDTISTGRTGCFSLKKMYPVKSYLELLNEGELQLKFKDNLTGEIVEIRSIRDKMYLLEETGELLVVLDDSKTNRKIPRCVEYADGRKAINVLFAVRDSLGRLIDTISTGADGCFSLKKMYPIKSYLELLKDDDFYLKFKEELSDDIIEIRTLKDKMRLLKDKGKLVLILDELEFAKKRVRCVEYADGRKAIEIALAVRDSSGALLDILTTDIGGCFSLKKLYPVKSYLELLNDEDEAFLTFRELESTEIIVIKGNSTISDKIGLTGKLIDMLHPDKSLGDVIIYIVGEDGFIKYSSKTDGAGMFVFRELPSDKALMLKINGKDLSSLDIKKMEVLGTVSNKEIYTTNAKTDYVYLNGDGNRNLAKDDLNANGDFSLVIGEEQVSILKQEAEGKSITESIRNIYFYFGKFELTEKSKKSLDVLVSYMNKHPNLSVKINSHTDCRGSDKVNLNLSFKRSASVKKYLIDQGVGEGRLSSEGFGETQPTNKCKDGAGCTEEEHLENRRTEFELIWN